MKIEFEPIAEGKNGQKIRSRFTADGSFPKRGKNLPVITTAKELKEFAAQLPDELPIEASFGRCVQPVWYNVGDFSEHIEFEEAEDEADDLEEEED